MASKRAGLKSGTTILDYTSPSRIMSAFGDDMRAIRAEYSRLRSIERKRIERMEEAGEIYNKFYKRYGNIAEALPATKTLSDREVLEKLSDAAMGIAGGYQSSLKEVRESRQDIIDTIRMEAEEAGDDELVAALRKNPTAKQMADVGKMMGMIKKTVGRMDDSNTLYQAALKSVLTTKGSLLTKTARVMGELGLLEDDESMEKLQSLKSMYTSAGNLRADYRKSQGKRR